MLTDAPQRELLKALTEIRETSTRSPSTWCTRSSSWMNIGEDGGSEMIRYEEAALLRCIEC